MTDHKCPACSHEVTDDQLRDSKVFDLIVCNKCERGFRLGNLDEAARTLIRAFVNSDIRSLSIDDHTIVVIDEHHPIRTSDPWKHNDLDAQVDFLFALLEAASSTIAVEPIKKLVKQAKDEVEHLKFQVDLAMRADTPLEFDRAVAWITANTKSVIRRWYAVRMLASSLHAVASLEIRGNTGVQSDTCNQRAKVDNPVT